MFKNTASFDDMLAFDSPAGRMWARKREGKSTIDIYIEDSIGVAKFVTADICNFSCRAVYRAYCDYTDMNNSIHNVQDA